MTHPFKAPAVVLDELGITEPSDINIEAIGEYCGATIVYEPLDGSEARILGSGDRAIITVNSNAPRERQRFSGGHELGHWMRDRGKVAFSCTDRNLVADWGDDDPERRANRYAADLLLPRKLFAAAARGAAPTFGCARDLARTFDTSLTATAIRLVELGSSPAMIVCTDSNGRGWFFRSPIIPTSVWPLSKPGQGSVARRLHSGALSRAPGPETVDADEWIDLPNASEYTLVEDSVFGGPGLVLALLWWKDEAQLLAIKDDDEEGAEELSGHLTFGRRSRRR